MRLRELLDHLKDYQEEDIIAIGVWTGNDWYSEAIGEVSHGKGIALLLTSKNGSRYGMKGQGDD